MEDFGSEEEAGANLAAAHLLVKPLKPASEACTADFRGLVQAWHGGSRHDPCPAFRGLCSAFSESFT